MPKQVVFKLSLRSILQNECVAATEEEEREQSRPRAICKGLGQDGRQIQNGGSKWIWW